MRRPGALANFIRPRNGLAARRMGGRRRSLLVECLCDLIPEGFDEVRKGCAFRGLEMHLGRHAWKEPQLPSLTVLVQRDPGDVKGSLGLSGREPGVLAGVSGNAGNRSLEFG